MQFAPLFVTCLFFVNLWTIFNTLRQVPSWLLSKDSLELYGIISYLLVLALIETLLLFLLIALAGLILPARLMQGKFAAQSCALAALASLWAAGLHLANVNFFLWARAEYVIAGALFLLSAAAVYLVVARFRRVEKAILAAADRVAVLSCLYLALDLLGLLFIILTGI
jgi:hypothetical protein